MAGHDDEVLVESGVIEVTYDEVRCRFEGLLSELFSEICAHFRPFPPMLGDGRNVDLYKLFMVVKGKGGYDVVCESKLWGLVAEESGLDLSVGSSVKLVYSRYLSALDAWMKKVADSKAAECGLIDDRDKFGKRLMELQAEVKGLLLDYAENDAVDEFKGEFDDEDEDGRNLCGAKGVKGLSLVSNGEKGVRYNGREVEMPRVAKNEYALGDSGDDAMEVHEEVNGGKVSAKPVVVVDLTDDENSTAELSTDGEKIDKDDGSLVLDASGGDGASSGHKRKRESMLDLLSWVTSIAMNPCDPAVGSMPEKAKWKSYGNEEVWKQVLSFRQAVSVKRSFESSSEQHNWQNQKMHPCMYDDNIGAAYNFRERSKCDKRLLLGKTVRSSSDSSVGSGGSDRTPSPHTLECARVRIPLGPSHQAEVPEWTGMTSESDSKWLGTKIWPSEKVNSRLVIERDPIGKGRQDHCGCSVPGSVDCVRFHIAEKKAKVNRELGAAFYQWNFDKIGEEVRHSWTKEEEKRFKNVVESSSKRFKNVVESKTPSPEGREGYFWDHIFRAFPKKSRPDLVSYYFNVFLLQRRAYQNRHTPKNIDSDDDESEDGLRTVFGNQPGLLPLKDTCGKTNKKKSRNSILLTPKKPQTKRR